MTNLGTLLFTRARSVFVAFVAVGATAILVWSRTASAADEFPGHFRLIGGIVLLMGAYGIYLWRRKDAGYASDNDGDTFYYLGFILTLATLVSTFTPMLASGEVSNVRQVLGLFGLGLITTFVGLAGRVLFSSFEAETTAATPEKEIGRLSGAIRELVQHTEGAANSIRIAHESLSAHFDSLQKAQAAVLDSHIKRTLDTLESLIGSASASILKITSAAEAHMTEATKRLKDQIAAVQFPSPSTMSKFDAAVRKATNRASAVDEAFGTIVSSAEGVSEAAGRATKGMQEVAEATVALGSSSKQSAVNLDGLASIAARSGNEIRGLTQEAAGLPPSLRSLSDAVANTANALSNPILELAKSLSSADAALTGVASAAQTVQASVAALAQDSKGARETLDSIVAAVQALAQRAGTGVEHSDAMVAALKAAVAHVNELGEAMRRHNAALEQLASTARESVRRSQDDIRKVHENLVASSTYILNKLG